MECIFARQSLSIFEWCETVKHVTSGTTQVPPQVRCYLKSCHFGESSQLCVLCNRQIGVLPGCYLDILCISSRRKQQGNTKVPPFFIYWYKLGNSYQKGNFSRYHPWVLPGCYHLWHNQRSIVNVDISHYESWRAHFIISMFYSFHKGIFCLYWEPLSW